MADETKVETETTEKTDAEPVEEEKTDEAKEPESSQIDYEAELAKEREARIKAEKAAADLAFKKRKEKREEPEESSDDDEEKPLTRKDIDQLLESNRQATLKQLQEREIQEIARDMSESDAEANLIVEIHRNRTFPSNLSLQEQLEESYAIANRKKVFPKIAELKRALKGKENANANPATAHRDAPGADEPKVLSQDAQAIKSAGMVWDGKLRLYKKALAGGKKYLYFDPKSKKRWTK